VLRARIVRLSEGKAIIEVVEVAVVGGVVNDTHNLRLGASRDGAPLAIGSESEIHLIGVLGITSDTLSIYFVIGG